MLYNVTLIRLRNTESSRATIGVVIVSAPNGDLGSRKLPEGWFIGFQDGPSLLRAIAEPENNDPTVEVTFDMKIKELMEHPHGTVVSAGVLDLSEQQLTKLGYRGHL
jgi:hypothetical protein